MEHNPGLHEEKVQGCQHVYAHCGVSMNERVDELAKEASAMPQEDAPVHLVDQVAHVKRQLVCHFQRSVRNTHRTQLVGRNWTPKQQLRLPRKQGKPLAQLRTGLHPKIGGFHCVLHITEDMACRWCCPDCHPQQAAEAPDDTVPTTGCSGLVAAPNQGCRTAPMKSSHLQTRHAWTKDDAIGGRYFRSVDDCTCPIQ